MRAARTIILALAAGLLFAGVGAAQETEETTAAPEQPNLAALGPTWWNYFAGTQEELRPRIDAFLEKVNQEIADLDPQNQAIAPALVEALRDNLQVYLSLLDAVDFQREPLPEPAEVYSLDELLDAAATARDALTVADAAQDEVEREQRTRDGVTRRRDAVFKDYLDAAEGDGRWLAALRVMRARSALAISERRLQILTDSARHASAFADEAADRVNLVRERLETTADEEALEALAAAVAERAEAVAEAEEHQREALIVASSLDVDTAQSRSEQRLLQQLALDADVEFAAARVALGKAEARRFWTELKMDADPDLGEIEDTSLAWTELLREVSEELPEWERATENELLAVQAVDRDALDRNGRRTLDQRIGTAQETLTHIGALGGSTADLELLMGVVDDAVAEYSGPFRLWLYNVGRTIRTAWTRVATFADTTLFSVGETPVTIGEIIQAVIILLIAMLLSRAMRYAIRRVGRKESIGTQASLYTISRLTHYTIIIVAVIIALTSIGLDFTNLALVAGALSVGIGFGLQSIVNNFVSGLIILFERSLRVGDYIELDNGLTGTVKAISVRSTLINTNDNIDIVVPNSEFVTTRLTNWTLGEHILRVRIPFGVAYGSDKELVRKAAIEACDEVSYTLTHMPGREPDVWLVEYGDSSLNFLLLVWVNRQGARRPTRTRAAYLWALETKFREYGIEIPFPQRDLHLKSGWTPPASEVAD
jgi:small-conductance mechanosensitive channel